MKKSDLKTGMIVETRNGREYVVFINTCQPSFCSDRYCDKNGNIALIINRENNLWTSLYNYNEELYRDNGDKSTDIMKVYVPSHPYSFMDITYEKEDRELIWEREVPIKEMTMKDLEKHFGCKIKIVES